MAPTLLVTTKLEEKLKERIQSTCPGYEYRQVSDEEEFAAHLPQAEIIFGHGMWLPGHIERAEKLRWLQCASKGVETMLSEQVARHPFTMTNAAVMQDDTIADHVMFLLLSHSRRAKQYFRQQDERTWERTPCWDLAGRTMGIAGLGGIGIAVARRAKASGMKIKALKRTPSLSSEQLQVVDAVYTPADAAEFWPDLDVLVLACPLTPETEQMVSEEILSVLPQQCYLINVGRGGLVDEEALVDALQAGTIAGAGLDVFATEPLPQESPLWAMEQVVITPHVAGTVPDYMARAVDIFLTNFERYRNDQPLLYCVDKELGY